MLRYMGQNWNKCKIINCIFKKQCPVQCSWYSCQPARHSSATVSFLTTTCMLQDTSYTLVTSIPTIKMHTTRRNYRISPHLCMKMYDVDIHKSTCCPRRECTLEYKEAPFEKTCFDVVLLFFSQNVSSMPCSQLSMPLI